MLARYTNLSRQRFQFHAQQQQNSFHHRLHSTFKDFILPSSHCGNLGVYWTRTGSKRISSMEWLNCCIFGWHQCPNSVVLAAFFSFQHHFLMMQGTSMLSSHGFLVKILLHYETGCVVQMSRVWALLSGIITILQHFFTTSLHNFFIMTQWDANQLLMSSISFHGFSLVSVTIHHHALSRREHSQYSLLYQGAVALQLIILSNHLLMIVFHIGTLSRH